MWSALILAILTIVLSTRGALVDDISCDFNEPFNGGQICGYVTTSENGNFSQKSATETRHSNFIDGPLTGPGNHGNYLSFSGSEGILSKTGIGLAGKYCLSLDYHILGEGSSLEISSSENELFFFRNSQSALADMWHHYESAFESLGPNSRVIPNTFTLRLKFANLVSIDNLKFMEGPCPARDVETCNFDAAFVPTTANPFGCPWLRPGVSNMEWQVSNLWYGRLGADITTHSTKGKFLKASPRVSHQGRSSARLVTRSIKPSEGMQCLSFYYRGELSISRNCFNIFEIDNNFSKQSVKEVNSAREDTKWRYLQLTINPIVEKAILIEVNHMRPVSFEDFQLSRGRCGVKIGSCTFNKDLCGYTLDHPLGRTLNLLNYQNFYIGRGRIDVRSSEYSNHHERLERRLLQRNRTENFLYRDYGNPMENKLEDFVLSSPTIDPGTYCYRIFHHGRNIETVTVKAMVQYFGGDVLGFTTIFAPVREIENWEWKEFRVDFTNKYPIFLQIQAKAGDFYETEYEIQKVILEEGTCAQVAARGGAPRVIDFPNVNFHCFKTGHYIPQWKKCDQVIDCPMGEDEGELCGGRDCSMAGIPCTIGRHKICLNDTTLYCDGYKDCQDGVDEDPRLCNEQQFCDRTCLNDGVCHYTGRNYNCDCAEQFFGKRCQFVQD